MNVTGGSTNVSVYFQMRLLAGGDATGLTITDFDISYTRNGAATAAKVDATDLGSADAAHTDNGGFEVDPTDCPGLHRFDFPDAAFAAGVRDVLCTIKHASCFTETLRVEIDAEVSVTEWNGVKLATTNPLPNAAADAAGGLPISDAGGLDLDAKLAATNEVTAARMGALTDWIDGGRLDLLIDAVKAKTDNLPTDPADASDIAAAFAALNDLDATAIQAAVQAALDEAAAEPTGVPAANASLLVKIGVLYMMARNKITVTSTKKTYHDDGDAAEFEKDLSDDGTTYTESEANAV